MFGIKSVITACGIVTAYGDDQQACWQGILSGTSAINVVKRFSTDSFQAKVAACIPELQYLGEDSLVRQMLESLFNKYAFEMPPNALLVFASVTGEIDILEKQVLEGSGDTKESSLRVSLEKIKGLIGHTGTGLVISSACASASAALGWAAGQIQRGIHDCVVVVAADAVTEFVFSGFSSLMALDPDSAKPFDAKRAGLSLGEGAGFVVVMSRQRALREKKDILGEIAGWASAGDANHMTGPSRDGSGLRRAIDQALAAAGITTDDVGAISGHGTGTVYNDAMEMKAYKSVFVKNPVALYSIKGALGHTMGAAGLIETVIALRALREKVIPQTLGLREVDPEAKGWAAAENRPLEKNVILLANAGFGGVNAALVVR